MARVARRLLDHVHDDPPHRDLAQHGMWNDMIEFVPGCDLTRASALLHVSSNENVDRLVRLNAKIEIWIFHYMRKQRQIIYGDLGKPVLKPTHFNARQVLDYPCQRRVGRNESPTSIFLRDALQFCLHGGAVKVEEGFKRCALVCDCSDLPSVKDVGHGNQRIGLRRPTESQA